ncbi:MAG: hypothetical protein QXD80_00735 [Acidilobaceae archaeon]
MSEKFYRASWFTKTLKIKLLPVSRMDKVLIYYLLKDCTALLRESLDIILEAMQGV